MLIKVPEKQKNRCLRKAPDSQVIRYKFAHEITFKEKKNVITES